MFTVAPFYGPKQGPFSSPVSLFKRGFYPETSAQGELSLRFCDISYAQDKLEISISYPLFPSAIETESVPPLSISVKDSGYLLTIERQPLAKNVWEQWIGALIAKGLTHTGYYRLLNIVMRTGVIPACDLLYYCAGIDSGSFADVMPGMILRVQTADYIRQPEKALDDIEGYVTGGTSEYLMSLREKDGSAWFEADSFLENVIGGWSPGSGAGSASANLVAGGGLIDMFQSSMRVPYYRLHYPGSFYASDVPGSFYPSDNIILMAAPSMDSMNNASNSPDAPGIPYMIFRGRSSVTLCFTVFVNNKPVSVPVGTTLGKLAARYGIYSAGTEALSGNVRLYRETALEGQPPAEVWLRWFDKGADDLFVLSGDRIEV